MPLDKITVKDIVDDCDISRNTFYYNYQDIYAVIEELFETELSALLESERTDTPWQQIFADVCSFLYKYKSTVYSMYNSSRRDFMEKQLRLLISGCLSESVRSASGGLRISEKDVEFISRFYTYAVEGFILDWVDGAMKEPIDVFVKRASRIFADSMIRELESASENFSTD